MADQTVNLVEGVGNAVSVKDVSLRIRTVATGNTGSGTDTLRVYASDTPSGGAPMLVISNPETPFGRAGLHTGDKLSLHPKMPALEIAALERGRFFVAHTPTDAKARREGKPWANATWLFFLEPIDERRSRLISRYRCATSDDIATRLSFGATVMEPIGFAMDRRMLLGVKGRVEGAAAKRRPSRSFARRSGASRVSAKQRG